MAGRVWISREKGSLWFRPAFRTQGPLDESRPPRARVLGRWVEMLDARGGDCGGVRGRFFRRAFWGVRCCSSFLPRRAPRGVGGARARNRVSR